MLTKTRLQMPPKYGLPRVWNGEVFPNLDAFRDKIIQRAPKISVTRLLALWHYLPTTTGEPSPTGVPNPVTDWPTNCPAFYGTGDAQLFIERDKS